jgi:Tfp pilus assembly protein PilF
LNQAVALAWLGRRREALAAGTKAVAVAPLNPTARLVLARILHFGRRRAEAGLEIERILEVEPRHAGALVLRARLQIDAGAPDRARNELDEAARQGIDGADLRATRAEASLTLGDPRSAAHDWTLALKYDPEDPRAYHGRARAFLAMGQQNAAIADLEQAMTWAAGRADLALPIALSYARCLPYRPSLAGRTIGLLRFAWSTLLAR